MFRYCVFVAFCFISFIPYSSAGLLDSETLSEKVIPPYRLGQPTDIPDVWTIINLDGADAGYIFETESLSPIPGFAGAPINMLVSITNEGLLLNVEIIHHNEPIFVSGLDENLLHEFVTQYRGKSITDAMSVGVPYGKVEGASSQIYLDGVTKGTASVRIAHETILASAFSVARSKIQGLGIGNRGGESTMPDLTVMEELTFQDLIDQGIAIRHQVTNKEVQALFENSEWESDDPIALAQPDDLYLDLWIISIGPPSIAKAVLDKEGLEKLNYFLSISVEDEPILLIEAGRHGLVSDDFVRNTEPDLLGARQGGLPIVLRDADLELATLPGVPQGQSLVVRTDRRLGFNPTRSWELALKVVRKHGSFMPTIGTVDLLVTHQTPKRFYKTITPAKPPTPIEAALLDRRVDLFIVSGFLLLLVLSLFFGLKKLAAHRYFSQIRIGTLLFVIVFIGWWGQGQLSIVTVLGVIKAAIAGQSVEFLLFDPFSLVIWVTVIGSFLYWGRGLFCGWLCPYGAMQELVAFAGKKLGIKAIRIPRKWDILLKKIKYVILAILVLMTIFAPAMLDTAAEVEPFKTAVTTYFIREWYFVAYGVLWLILGMFVYKGFCRYVCPLGAVMAIGGLLRRKNWIDRYEQCGKPCQLCSNRCQYQAIKPSGSIAYDECFQCLDCVTIYESPDVCAPAILQKKGKKHGPIKVKINP